MKINDSGYRMPVMCSPEELLNDDEGIDHPTKVVDEVIAEVRAIKRGISERHGNDIDRLLASLISQERASETNKTEQVITRSESEPGGDQAGFFQPRMDTNERE